MHIKRFEEGDNGIMVKNKKGISYGHDVNLSEFTDKAWGKDSFYDLIGLIVHKGKTLERGHYVSLTKRSDNNWYYCNDSQV